MPRPVGRRLVRLLLGAGLVLLLWAASGAVAGEARAAPDCRFRLRVAALTDVSGTEVALRIISSAPRCRTPVTLRAVRITIYTRTGRLRNVRVFRSVSLPNGRASLALQALARRERLGVTVSFARRVLKARALVRLRPDLVLAPAASVTTVAAATPSTIDVVIAERNRDIGAIARVTAFLDGSRVGSSALARVRPGRRLRVRVAVTLAAVGRYALLLRIADTAGREKATSNNDAPVTVEVGDFELDAAQVLVPSLAGYGAQLNQNVYAAISREVGVTEENVPEMESKLVALQPQLVRIFFNRNAFRDPDLMQSFVRTVQLAQRAGAIVNVTWAGGGENDPATSMAQFGDVLGDLVKNRGITNLRWVTVENEPNRTRNTMAQYEALYRALDRDLTARGVRKQVRFMGGDLVEARSPLGQTQRDWFTFLGTRMADLLDAYSIHVFWDYWDTPKLVRRLTEVRQIVDALPAGGRRPLYVTEFSARGNRTLNGVGYPEPGVYADGTPLAQTTINAFQHAWLGVLAARLGYAGALKWDGYFGKYDRNTLAYSLIGPPQEGWPLRPVYNLMRLFTQTTRRGWKVVGVAGAPGTKLVAAYAGPNRRVTVIGLDTAGATLVAPSTTTVSYSIGGLPSGTPFQLSYWNQDGGGAISPPAVVRSDDAGMIQVTAPLQSVFAVTSLGA